MILIKFVETLNREIMKALTEDTRKKLDILKLEYDKASLEVILEEARKNNPYKKGDILEDHFQIGEVIKTRISTNVDYRTYSISYKCNRLNKKLKPYRGGEQTIMYLDNVKR